jgi:hypothetical protein
MAALYARDYGTHYPGGILWVDVGKQCSTAEDITPILQKILMLVYTEGVKWHLSENEEISPQLNFGANLKPVGPAHFAPRTSIRLPPSSRARHANACQNQESMQDGAISLA